jgi:hypothetical protein
MSCTIRKGEGPMKMSMLTGKLVFLSCSAVVLLNPTLLAEQVKNASSRSSAPAVATRLSITYYLPFVAHVATRDGNQEIAIGKDGFGRDVDGMKFPLYDTLISASNPVDDAINPAGEDVFLTFKFFDHGGKQLRWSDGALEGTYHLKHGQSIATSLISGNVFGPERGSPCPPQDFVGYGIVEVKPAIWIPIWAMLGGGGFYPGNWNKFSAELPIYTEITARKRTLFPYVIPFFEDANHTGADSYRTGMAITNFSSESLDFIVDYSLADFYGERRGYRYVLRLGPGEMYTGDIYTELLKAGYVPRFNSEGHLTVTMAAPAKATVYLLIANRDYNDFSVGEAGIPIP